MGEIIYLNNLNQVEELATAMGSGKKLSVSMAQANSLKGNASASIIEIQKNMQNTETSNVSENVIQNDTMVEPEMSTTMEASPVELNANPSVQNEPVLSATDVTPTFDMNQMPVEPVVEEEPKSINEPIMNEQVSIPEVSQPEIPNVQEVTSVVEPQMGQVEIVSETPKMDDYDKLMNQIKEINEKYDAQIVEINQQRNKEIDFALKQCEQTIKENVQNIIDFKSRAEEHLKNAQAAEEIATMAQQNAQNMQNQIQYPSFEPVTLDNTKTA